MLFLLLSFHHSAWVELFEVAMLNVAGTRTWNMLYTNWTVSAQTGHAQWRCQPSETHLESLADSWIQHGPIHSAVHSDRTDKEILLFDLLLTQSATNRRYGDCESHFTVLKEDKWQRANLHLWRRANLQRRQQPWHGDHPSVQTDWENLWIGRLTKEGRPKGKIKIISHVKNKSCF